MFVRDPEQGKGSRKQEYANLRTYIRGPSGKRENKGGKTKGEEKGQEVLGIKGRRRRKEGIAIR